MEACEEIVPVGRGEAAAPAEALALAMLGPLSIRRGGRPLPQPGSRKVRLLLAYLIMAPRALHRSKLCELFWDVPNDPRGELRWCLSKIRAAVNEPGDEILKTEKDWVSIRADGITVDALAVEGQAGQAVEGSDPAELLRLEAMFGGDFLEGLDAVHMPMVESWLLEQRERFGTLHGRIVSRLAALAAPQSDDQLAWLRKAADLRPYDVRLQGEVLACLAARGQIDEGEAHLQAATRLFQSNGLHALGLKSVWHRAKATGPGTLKSEPGVAAQPLGLLVRESFASKPLGIDAGAENGSARADGGSSSADRRARPAVAVLPFECLAADLEPDRARLIADGLLRDVIRSLARCRTIAVIAASSARILAGAGSDPVAAGRLVGVDYVCAGTFALVGGVVRLDVELVAVRQGQVLRSDRYEAPLSDAMALGLDIAADAARAMASEIEFTERNKAATRPVTGLTAWESYHRGMWHLHRLNRDDNTMALAFFEASVELDGTYARAHAGSSFAHWLSGLMFSRGDADQAARQALDTAMRGASLDPFDPAAHCALGRAYWMEGALDEAVAALESSIALSPSFACGHYSLGIVQAFSGDPERAIVAADQARQLSPFDPFLGAMQASRAIALLRLGRIEEAAAWGLRAARAAQAHPHIMLIAAACAASAGRRDEAQRLVAQVSPAGIDSRPFLSVLKKSGIDPVLGRTLSAHLGAA